MNKFVVYHRASTQKRGDSGLGLEAQGRDVNLYLENYAGEYVVLESFTDVASGADSDRPELQKAIKLAKKERAILLVAKLDRLSRKVSFIASLIEDQKLQLIVACMPHADKFQLHIYAVLAEQEREFISIRTKQALREARNRGVKLGGYRGATEKMNEAARAKADKEAEKIRWILSPLVKSGASTRAIAEQLNKAGIKTARGNEFQSMQVSRLIKRLDLCA